MAPLRTSPCAKVDFVSKGTLDDEARREHDWLEERDELRRRREGGGAVDTTGAALGGGGGGMMSV